jgi:hypothetical protein
MQKVVAQKKGEEELKIANTLIILYINIKCDIFLIPWECV